MDRTWAAERDPNGPGSASSPRLGVSLQRSLLVFPTVRRSAAGALAMIAGMVRV